MLLHWLWQETWKKLLVLFVSQRRENKYASDCMLKQLYVRIYLKKMQDVLFLLFTKAWSILRFHREDT